MPDAPPLPAEVRETHLSWVFLVGDLALKLPKPVRTPFVDQSSPARRAEACRREVTLNRRLAPDVYLGAAALAPDGEVLDHLVVMRRLPDERRLSVLAAGPGMADAVTAVAHRLAAFHAGLPPDPRPREVAGPEALAGLWDRSLEQTAGLLARPGTPSLDGDAPLAELGRLAHRFLDGRHPLLEQRIAEGRVVDGHGDLLADDVFVLDDGPRLLDCLAFDDHLRRGDVLADAAFLAMDLERVGGPAAARTFLDAWAERTGEQYPAALAHHYVAYRALVRAKVGLLDLDPTAAAGRVDSAPAAGRLRTVRAHLRLCGDHLRRGDVRLTLVGGAPGTGKSTLADALAEPHDGRPPAVVVRTDEVRKELAGVGATVRLSAGLDEAAYSPAATAATYDTVLDRAERLLGMGESVVLDGSWDLAARRRAVRRLADRCAVPLVELCCTADPVTAAARVARRQRQGGDASDVDPVTAEVLRRRREPWPEATEVSGPTPAASLDLARSAPSRPPLPRRPRGRPRR